MLQTRPELTIAGTASDGLEAVHRAQELQPDLILLDLGLPKLNGLEASREIRQLSPKSKIIFLSQTLSNDVVKAAFCDGAYGYVAKVDAGTELLIAVDAALRGETFVSRRLSELEPLTAIPKDHTGRHNVAFFSNDRLLLDHLTEFIGTALNSERAAIVVATESHRSNLLLRLQGLGIDVEAEVEKNRLLMLDAAAALSSLMASGMPDQDRFFTMLADVIVQVEKAASKDHAPIAVYGEIVDLLWKQGNIEAAIALEQVGDRLSKTYNIEFLHGYSLNGREEKMSHSIIDRICAEHSAAHFR